MKVSIVLPVYNEEKAVGKVIEDIKAVMKGHDYEIIAVNDCSKDRSGEVLDSKGIRVIHHSVNKGYGASLKTGIRAAKNEVIVMLDADGTYPVDAIPELLKYADDYDMVSGVRRKEHIPAIRRPAKKILNWLANIVAETKVPDINCGLRVIKKSKVMKFFNILPSRFSFTITHILACLTNDYAVKFVPIEYHKRVGKSTIKTKDFFNFISLIFRITMYFNPLKIFLPVSLVIFLAGFVILLYDLILFFNIYDTPVILLLTSIQIGFLGLIADLIIKRTKNGD